jgi:hypothetical protein
MSPEWTVVEWAGGCTSCGSPTPCRQWTVADVLTCQPYPCLCQSTKDSAPDHITNPQCWWRKKGTGIIASRCPCWGRQRDDRLPEDCCSRHDANPAHLLVHPDAVPDTWTGEGAEPAGSVHVLHTRGQSGAAHGEPADPARAAYTRLWDPREVTCPCPTPWDGNKRAIGGHHCVSCHTNWANTSTASVHWRRIGEPCRDPESIVDVDTGRPLFYARDVRGARVWAFA